MSPALLETELLLPWWLRVLTWLIAIFTGLQLVGILVTLLGGAPWIERTTRIRLIEGDISARWFTGQALALLFAVGCAGALLGSRRIGSWAVHCGFLLGAMQSYEALTESRLSGATIPISAIFYLLFSGVLERHFRARATLGG